MIPRFPVSSIWIAAGALMLSGAPDPDLFDGRYSEGFSTTGSEAHGDGEDSGEDSGKLSSESSAGDVVKTESQKSGSEKSSSGSSPAGSASSESRPVRSFEDFGIGAVDKKKGQIEANYSKDFGEPSSPVSKSSNPTAHSTSKNADKNASKSDPADQEVYDGGSNVDYGKNIPVGL